MNTAAPAATAYGKMNYGAQPDGIIYVEYATEKEARAEVRRAFVEFYGYKPVRVIRVVKGAGVKFEARGAMDDLYRRDVMFLWV